MHSLPELLFCIGGPSEQLQQLTGKCLDTAGTGSLIECLASQPAVIVAALRLCSLCAHEFSSASSTALLAGESLLSRP